MNIDIRIEQAKKRAEDNYLNKVAKSRQSDVDVCDFFSDEELDRILTDNDFFKGKVADLTKLQRHEKLATAARWLDANCMEVVYIEVQKPAPTRPNAIVLLELRRLSSLRDQELRIFTAMCAMADTMFLSNLKDETIRFTFGVENLYP